MEGRLVGAAVPVYGLLPPPGAPTRAARGRGSPPALTYSVITSGAAAAANYFRGQARTAQAHHLPAGTPAAGCAQARYGFPPASERLLRTLGAN